jgi:HK97 family phage portal protein
VFPEITSRLKGMLDGFNSKPVSLDLKAAGGFSFDAVNVGWYARNGHPGLYSILSGGMPAWSGEVVSLETALNHSVVWACTRLISESTGFIPLVMLQQKGGVKNPAIDHPMFSAMRNAPSDEMTAMTFRETLTSHCLLQGNAYAQIFRRSGTGEAIELHPLLPSQVVPDRERGGQHRLIYVVKDGNSPEKTYTVERNKPHDLLHIRGIGPTGICGFSVITMARQSIGTAIATERNVGRFFANGGRVPYLLEHAQKFKNDADFDKFRDDWEKTYQQAHKAPILENGLSYKQIGLSMADSQMLETRLFDIHEICRWFLVSPHLVGDLSRATFSNIEQLALEFVKMTLSAWITRWEQELWRCVLTPEEKTQGYFFKHNLNALLRGDFQSRMTGYATMLQNGVASVDDVRDLEDWNKLPDGIGEDYHIQLNMQPLPANQTPGATQASGLVRLGSKPKSN